MIAIDPLPEDKAREVVHQIVDGVQHLHALNIVHLDLKVKGVELEQGGGDVCGKYFLPAQKWDMSD